MFYAFFVFLFFVLVCFLFLRVSRQLILVICYPLKRALYVWTKGHEKKLQNLEFVIFFLILGNIISPFKFQRWCVSAFGANRNIAVGVVISEALHKPWSPYVMIMNIYCLDETLIYNIYAVECNKWTCY